MKLKIKQNFRDNFFPNYSEVNSSFPDSEKSSSNTTISKVSEFSSVDKVISSVISVFKLKEQTETDIALLNNQLDFLTQAPNESKSFIFNLLTSIYIKNNEKRPSIAKNILDFLKRSSKTSLSTLHIIILNVFSCKHVYKKYMEMGKLKKFLVDIINNYEFSQDFSPQIYTSIFNSYNTLEEFIEKNLVKFDDVSDFVHNGKVRWNSIMLVKRKNDLIASNNANEKWLYIVSEINFINDLVNISVVLKGIESEFREEALKEFILYINKEALPTDVYNPLSNNFEGKLLKIDESFSYPITTKERVPCQLIFEYSYDDETYSPTNELPPRGKGERRTVMVPRIKVKDGETALNNIAEWFANNQSKSRKDSMNERRITEEEFKEKRGLNQPDSAGIFGPFTFSQIEKSVLKNSKFKSLTKKYPHRHIVSSIIKGNDELRQDYFISQMVNLFNSIFEESKINIHLTSYKILTNGMGGFMQTIINSASISAINKIKFEESFFYHEQSSSLKKYFSYKFENDTEAKGNFISSLAGYSLLCYFFEIKDRNNGNILLDDKGNLIHIDYGFLFNRSPGGISFEKSPFKFTLDFLEVIGGVESPEFISFQNIFFKGFLALKKKKDVIIDLCEIFCFLFGDVVSFEDKKDVIKRVKEKFFVETEEEDDIRRKCNEMIFQSIDNWRTNAYDRFQKFCVGVN